MFDRTRLAVGGGVLAVAAFAFHALMAWTDYQRDFEAYRTENFDWVPRFWRYLRNGMGMTMSLLLAFGIAMLTLAWSMRPPPEHDDAIFRAPD